jgi:hypothetical protein
MQIHPAVLEAVVQERERNLTGRRRTGTARARTHAAGAAGGSRSVSIRLARSADAADVRRLVGLDAGSAEGVRVTELVDSGQPPGVLLAEAGGALVAALELDAGRSYGDPFRPSAGAVDLLRARSAKLRGERRGRAPRLSALVSRLQPRRT